MRKTSPFCLLMKVQLQRVLQLKNLSQRRGRGALVLAGFAILIALVAYLCYQMGYALCLSGLAVALPPLALAVSALAILFFTVLKTNGILFGYQDYDLLMSLPVKTSTVIFSRLAYLYLSNTLLTALFLLPMGLAYVQVMGPGPGFYITWLLFWLLGSLIPTTIAALLGTLLTWFSSRFRFSNLLSIVLTFVLVLGIMVLSFSFNAGAIQMEEVDLLQIGGMLAGQIARMYPPAWLITLAVTQGSWGALALFVLLSLAVAAIFVALLSLRYKRICSALRGHRVQGHYKLTRLKTSSPRLALCKKELRRFFSCSIYVTNMGVGLVLALIAAVVLVVKPDLITNYLGLTAAGSMAPTLSTYILGLLISMSCPAAVSLSLEGRNLWLVQSLPLAPKTVFQGKILAQWVLSLPVALVCGLGVAIAFPMAPLDILAVFAYLLGSGLFFGVFGCFLNILMPNYAWESEVSVVKQSASSMAGIFGSMIIAMIPLFVTLFAPIAPPLIALGYTVLLLIAGLILYRRICAAQLITQ